MLSILIWAISVQVTTSQFFNTLNPPHGCSGFGYCYPEYRVIIRSGETVCSNCTCSIENPQLSAIGCELTANCVSTRCPSTGNWKCEMVKNRPKCLCEDDWTGRDCDIEKTSPCASIPCLGRGMCKAQNDTYKCDCDAGYYGQQCQYFGDPCATRCLNGGTCTFFDKDASVYCDCRFGFYGDRCHQQLPPNYKHHGCLDDSNLGFLNLIGYTPLPAGTAISELLCFDQLQGYRAKHREDKFKFATWIYESKKCFFSDENKLDNPNYLRRFNGCREPAMLGTVGTRSGGHVYELLEPCTTMNCNTGICYPRTPDSASCICPKDANGAKCQFAGTIGLPNQCGRKDCGAGTCAQTDDGYDTYCKCNDGSTNKTTCATDICSSYPCENGGTCVPTPSGFDCICLSLYSGPTCAVFNSCHENQCLNGGSCNLNENGLESTFSCNCTDEWRGTLCEIEIMPCDYDPCENGANCTNIINQARNTKSFNCTCTKGWTGQRCEEDIDECIVLGDDLCTTRDDFALCENLLHGEYKCNCSSPMWTGEHCHINKYIFDIVNATYGYVNEKDLDQLTKELIGDPTAVRDLVPFIIGGYSTEERMRLSWDYEDIFTWVAYEERLIDFRSDFVRWNDKVLGNCFTFNHQNSSTMYKARLNGYPGGLALEAKVRSEEYLPWIETAALMVFTHSTLESIFSESPRINCRGNHQANIYLHPTVHERLGGVYGKCIRDKTEVASYYYSGSYTTDGCLRSCYQDVMKAECGCMDPRYPMPEEEQVCGMGQRVCIESTIELRGDPSQWKECECPLSCHSQTYDVTWSEQPFISQNLECTYANDKDECNKNKRESVLLNAGLPSLAMHTFVEVPKMDLVSFLSQLGGLLGVLMGFSFVSFVEFGFLFAKLAQIMLTKNKTK